ncbi:MAG TPA: hypothetical protein VE091_01810, partial [Gemmatimonadales bacterium]|nr:hypothetical protein [Gemmatimonadales bacterium]
AHCPTTRSPRYSPISPLGGRVLVQPCTVLVVDKAELVRRAANRILTKEGYRVLEAGNATEALGLLARAPRVDLVLIGTVGQ